MTVVIGLGSQDPNGDLIADRRSFIDVVKARPHTSQDQLFWCKAGAKSTLCLTDELCPHLE